MKTLPVCLLFALALFSCTLNVAPTALADPLPEETHDMGRRDYSRVRWGDLYAIQIPGGIAGLPAPVFTQQLCRAQGEDMAETWKVLIYADLAGAQPDTAGGWVFTFAVTIGMGSAPLTLNYQLTIDGTLTTPVQTPYSLAVNNPQVWMTFELPAHDFFITASVQPNFLPSPSQPSTIAAFVAPLVKSATDANNEGDAGREHFMPPGFPGYNEGTGQDEPVYQEDQPFGAPLRFHK